MLLEVAVQGGPGFLNPRAGLLEGAAPLEIFAMAQAPEFGIEPRLLRVKSLLRVLVLAGQPAHLSAHTPRSYRLCR